MLSNYILQATDIIFSIHNLMAVASGVAGGVLIGALPGLSATMAIALLVPITYGMSTNIAFLVLIGVYCGAVYGSSISAILIGIPGTPSAAATWIDGFPMTKKGMASKALGGSIVASFIGGTFSAIILVLMAPFLARQALKFGPPEYFALAVFGLSIVVALIGESLLKTGIVTFIGLILATFGMDPILGYARFTFHNINLISGIPFACAVIGIFGSSQVLMLSQQEIITEARKEKTTTKYLPTLRELKECLTTIIKSAIIGTGIGIIPGAGSSFASFVAYSQAKKSSKHPEKFGTGILEGVIAPDTANNAVTGGSMVPLLSLGIPGNAVSAVFIGALMIHGLEPGPLLFKNSPEIVHTIFIGFFLANIFMLIYGLLIAKYMSVITTIPTSILSPTIFVLCVVGSYAIRNNMFDVGIMLLFGLMSYFLRKYGFSVIPIVIALILGPIAERSFYQSLIISRGSFLIFFQRPISLALLIITLLSLLGSVYKKLKDVKKENIN